MSSAGFRALRPPTIGDALDRLKEREIQENYVYADNGRYIGPKITFADVCAFLYRPYTQYLTGASQHRAACILRDVLRSHG